MVVIEKIIKSDIAPTNGKVLWLNTTDNRMYVFTDAGWIPTSATGGASHLYVGTNEERLAMETMEAGDEFNVVATSPKGNTYVVKYIYNGTAWVAEEATLEIVEVHFKLWNDQHEDVTDQDENMIGQTLTCTVDEETVLTSAIDADHVCTFEVPFGSEFVITGLDGVTYEYYITKQDHMEHTATEVLRVLHVEMTQQLQPGAYAFTTEGKVYEESAIADLDASEKAKIEYIAVAHSRLARPIFIKLVGGTAGGKMWASDNVEFDQLKLPFKTSHAAALGDLDGKTNTDNIIEIGEGKSTQENPFTTPAASWCRSQTATINGVAYEGFLPAYGQLYSIYENMSAINAIRTALSQSSVNYGSGYWWSSTQYSASNAVGLNLGSFGSLDKTYTTYTTLVVFAL